MIKLFLDTNCLCTDPFWKNWHSSIILRLAEEQKIRLFLSDIVLQELRIQYQKKLRLATKELGNLLKTYNQFLPTKKTIDIKLGDTDEENLLADLDKFYEELKNRGVINVLPTQYLDGEFYNILDRAIAKKKPFKGTDGESDAGFKDAAIWFTYVKFIQRDMVPNKGRHEGVNYVFCTNNKKDFCDKEGNLHPDLKNDCDYVVLINSLDSLFDNDYAVLNKVALEFKEKIDGLHIDDKYVIDFCKCDHSEFLKDLIRLNFRKIDPADWNLCVYKGGLLDVSAISIQECSKPRINLFEESAYVSGFLNINVVAEVYGYFENELHAPELQYVGIEEFICNVKIDFKINKSLEKQDFEAELKPAIRRCSC